MNCTMKRASDYENMITVDIVGLMTLLSCGRLTAKNVADQAGASIKIGKRRLYNVQKVREYISQVR